MGGGVKPGTVQDRRGREAGFLAELRGGRRRHGCIGTYQAGCRCDDCREAKRVYTTADDRQRAHRMARGRAAKVLRQMHPDIYQQMFLEALKEIQDEHKPPPSGSTGRRWTPVA